MAEHSGRNMLVIHAALSFAKQALGHHHTLGQCHRRELIALDHITDGMNRGHIGLELRIDQYCTIGRQGHAGLGQSELCGIGMATGGRQHQIGLQRAAIVGLRQQQAVRCRIFLQVFDSPAKADVDTFFLHLLSQYPPQIGIELAQQLLATIDQRGVHTQAIENGGEFHRDIPTTDHHRTTRQLRQRKGFVGGDRQICTRKIRSRWPAAGGQQNVARRDATACHLHAMRSAERGTALQYLHPGAVQNALIDTIQALDLAILVGDEARPVKARGGGRFSMDIPAETACMLEVLGIVRGIGQ